MAKLASKERYKELLDEIKRYPIADYAASLGFTVVHKGHYLSLKEHDSVRINPVKNLFWRNSSPGVEGSIIDFCCAFEGMDYKKAVAHLKKYTHQIDYTPVAIPEGPDRPKEFVLPTKNTDMKRVYAYLMKTRKIDSAVVNYFVHRGQLYQEAERGNCVWVSYDPAGQSSFACKRGTNPDKRFVGDVAGSDYKHCFSMINPGAHKLIVTESTIDLMSVMTKIHRAGQPFEKYSYVALTGVGKVEAVLSHLQENPEIDHVVMAVDNDAGGLKSIKALREMLDTTKWSGKLQEHLPPPNMDWNDLLVSETDDAEKIMRSTIGSNTIKQYCMCKKPVQVQQEELSL